MTTKGKGVMSHMKSTTIVIGPQPGPQEMFLATQADIAGYG